MMTTCWHQPMVLSFKGIMNYPLLILHKEFFSPLHTLMMMGNYIIISRTMSSIKEDE